MTHGPHIYLCWCKHTLIVWETLDHDDTIISLALLHEPLYLNANDKVFNLYSKDTRPPTTHGQSKTAVSYSVNMSWDVLIDTPLLCLGESLTCFSLRTKKPKHSSSAYSTIWQSLDTVVLECANGREEIKQLLSLWVASGGFVAAWNSKETSCRQQLFCTPKISTCYS